MMIILTCINVFHLFLYVLLLKIPHLEFLLFIEVLAGAGAAFSPASNALIAKYMGPLEQVCCGLVDWVLFVCLFARWLFACCLFVCLIDWVLLV
jgi:hypothetical protein